MDVLRVWIFSQVKMRRSHGFTQIYQTELTSQEIRTHCTCLRSSKRGRVARGFNVDKRPLDLNCENFADVIVNIPSHTFGL